MKKSFGLLLLMVLLLITAAAGAATFTDGDWEYGTDEPGTLYVNRYLGHDTSVKIPGTVMVDGVPCKVRRIAKRAFADNISLSSVTIPASVTSIGNCAFKNCTGLTSVTICGDLADASDGSSGGSFGDYSVFYNAGTNTDGITVTFEDGVAKIPGWLFATGAEASKGVYANVKEVNIPDTVEYIGSYCFANCYKLQTVNIDGGNMSLGNGVFYGDTALKSIALARGTTSIGKKAFYGCISLSSISFGKKLTDIGESAFEGCRSLLAIDLPTTIRSLGDTAFKNCGMLSSVTIRGTLKDQHERSCWDGDYSRSYAVFYGAGIDGDGMTVSIIDEATRVPAYLFATGEDRFNKHYAYVTEIEIGDEVTEIGQHAFYRCFDIKKVTLGKRLTTIGKCAFNDAIRLKNITFNKGLQVIGEWAFCGCSALKAIDLPSSVSTLGRCAFAYCTSLASITVRGTLKDMHERSAWDGDYSRDHSVFYNVGVDADELEVIFTDQASCVPAYMFATGKQKADDIHPHVTSVTLGDCVKTVGVNAFQNCFELEQVDFGHGVQSIGAYAFGNCTALKAIDLPASVNSLGNVAFKNCVSLSQITFHGNVKDMHERCSWDGYSKDHSAFFNAGTATDGISLTFADGVTRVAAYLFATGQAQIDRIYPPVTELYLADTVTEIGDFAFRGCYNLTSVTLSNSLQKIGGLAFMNCVSLPAVELPDSLSYIGEFAFENCYALQEIALSPSLSDLCRGAFKNCKGLTSVTIRSNLHDMNERSSWDGYSRDYSVFYNCGADGDGIVVTVSEGVTRLPKYMFATAYDKTSAVYPRVTQLVLPATLKAVGDTAFLNCYDLTTAIAPADSWAAQWAASNGMKVN